MVPHYCWQSGAKGGAARAAFSHSVPGHPRGWPSGGDHWGESDTPDRSN